MAQGPYDHPTVLARRWTPLAESGGAATTTYAHTVFPPAGRLRKVHFTVTLAGTATTHAYDIFVGTASVGNVSVSTNTAGAVVASSDLNTTLTSTSVIAIKSGADATGKAIPVIEHEVTPDATWS